MMYIYFWVIGMLSMGIIVWFLGNYLFTDILTTFETKWPSYYAGSGPDFAVAFMRWMPLTLILITVIIYAAVQSQKPREAYG